MPVQKRCRDASKNVTPIEPNHFFPIQNYWQYLLEFLKWYTKKIMEIQVADQRILLFSPQVTPEDAKKRAWDKKMDAFGTFNKVASFLTRPQDNDFELLYAEHRYEPYWHVIAKSKYVYDRTANYQVATSGTEVKSITLHDTGYDVMGGHFHLPVMEHCAQDGYEEVLMDGITSKRMTDGGKYLSFSPALVGDVSLESLVPTGSILVPPQARVSGIMREALSKMIIGIQADTIHEEHVEVTCIDLYYRPVYAYQYKWISKNKEAIVEVDGLTGEIQAGSRVFREYLGKALDKNFLFDIAADATGMFIPGGSIAVKVAKKYLDSKQ
jgi:hypothetical protein